MNNSTAIITALENAPALIVPLVREVPAAVLKLRPSPSKWSAHEHACHLSVVHPLFFTRLDLMLADPAPRLKAYQPDADDEPDLLAKMDLDEALERFVRDRATLVERLKGLSEADWQRTAEHPEYSHYSMTIMFRHLALHDSLHAYRIEELLLKNDWPASAATN